MKPRELLQHGALWSFENLKIVGVSLSGIRTCLTLPEWGLCFDVAQGLPFALPMRHFFITHGHLDHAAGIPYILSQKALHHQPPPTFYVPSGLREPLLRIIRAWEDIEQHRYEFALLEVKPGDQIEINKHIQVQVFPTLHRVPSQGYSIVRNSRRRKLNLGSLSESELRHLAQSGEEVSEPHQESLISFTGDTQIEYLDLAPAALKSKVLVTECTYLDSEKPIPHARKWGHLHWDELRPRLSEIQAQKILLIHLSSRYSLPAAQKIIDQNLSPEDQKRVEIFPGQ